MDQGFTLTVGSENLSGHPINPSTSYQHRSDYAGWGSAQRSHDGALYRASTGEKEHIGCSFSQTCAEITELNGNRVT